jgi:hypothetical protein
MKRVIEYLMEINWDWLPVSDVVDKLKQKFTIVNRQGEEAAEELLMEVIFWEKHTEIYDSLEKILNNKFILK